MATRKTYPGMTNLELVQRIRERQPGKPRAVSQDLEKKLKAWAFNRDLAKNSCT